MLSDGYKSDIPKQSIINKNKKHIPRSLNLCLFSKDDILEGLVLQPYDSSLTLV